VACEKFTLARWTLSRSATVGGDDKMRMIAVISGAMDLECPLATESLKLGHCILLPAAGPACELRPAPHCVFLEIRLPD
jgi:mannose-6-phosphate isomerase class I